MANFRIRNDVGATVFALLAGLSALFFTAWIFGPHENPAENNPRVSPIPERQESDAGPDEKAAEAASALSEEAGRRAELAEQVSVLRRENESLRTQLKQAASAVAEAAVLEQKLNAVEIERDALSKKVDALQKQFTEAKKAKSSAKPAKAKGQKNELESLRKKHEAAVKACEAEKRALNAEITRLKKEIESLEKSPKPAKPAAAPVGPKLDLPMLVNDTAKLSPSFSSLFQSLNEVKGGPEERRKIYEEIKKDGKNTDIHLVPFTVGSSEMSAKEESTLSGLLKDTPKSVKFFVVGYASKDGDAASNRKLSSERASKVAQKIVELTGIPTENVSAVYFGQTTRFDSEQLPPNRVVEVWRVR